MAQILGLPKLSPTMEEGVLVRWTKKEGDKVSPGDLVAEVETDKANMDFNIEDEGVLLKLLVNEGDTVKLGAPVAIIGKAGEDVSALVEEAKAQSGAAPADKPAAEKPEAKPAAEKPEGKPAAEKPAAKPAAGKPAVGKPAAGKPATGPGPRGIEDSANAPASRREPREATRPEQRGESPAAGAEAAQTARAAKAEAAKAPAPAGGRLLASPLAKSLAIELGIDLRTIQGTGPGGRIVERDVRAAAEGGAAGAAEAPSGPEGEAEGEAAAEGEGEGEAESEAAAAPRARVADDETS
ncbi:MAG TPA: biotin/lipoyl-containing protein, partial [Kofleriaceae bacterium]|nr:biotin/lipoyl-containing protein [Kofleriaceae bacterium]